MARLRTVVSHRIPNYKWVGYYGIHVMQQNTEVNWIEVGEQCPAFVAERAQKDFEGHSVVIDEAAYSPNHDQPTHISMQIDLDGGILLFDDGNTIVRRVVSEPETLEAAFIAAVQETVNDYESRRGVGDLEIDYYPAGERVEFDLPVSVTVHE